jgi:methionyl-tRNA formyltransferase
VRVVFMGTPAFAVPSLRALAASHELIAVYTRPDAASGRGSQLRPSAVKIAAEELGVPVLQPATLRDPDVLPALRAFDPDLLVVAAYGLILPRDILELPRHDAVNVHASLLPRWRGAAPIQRAILAGDEVTGVSIMQMEEGLDTGPYCEVVALPLGQKSAEVLTDELAELGAGALLRALDRMSSGTCEWTLQDDTLATYAEKVTKADVRLSPLLDAGDFLRRVRASTSQAPARLAIGSMGITVLLAEPCDTALECGRVAVVGGSVLFGTSAGTVSVTELKPDGKRGMDAASWARGAAVDASSTWDAVS